MSNTDAISLLEEIRRLMELAGENPFKARAYERAAETLSGLSDPSEIAERARAGTLTELPGIGKGIADVIAEFVREGRSLLRDQLASSLPPGLVELTELPGLGPKKARVLIEELGIHSVGELEYACRENRLLKLKGFGEKIQHKILQSIQFMNSHRGEQRLDDVFPLAERLMPRLVQAAGGARVSETGALRRRRETLSAMEFVVEKNSEEACVRAAVEEFEKDHQSALPVKLTFAAPSRFGYELARTTATDAHWKALEAPAPFDASTEDEFFEKFRLPSIAPEMRETGEEVVLARAGALDQVLPWDGVRGIFHNHTTRSDGTATVEQMVIEAKKQGYSYIGISDHSQSAFYAQGLKSAALLEQEREIRAVQEKYPEIRVFWGIESDILADGSLDYDPAVLKKFDFVIASVHSRFSHDRETMTKRILEAIRNPYTRFLGHATGRLLLGRPGYELEMEKIIAEAARHDVAIEINANPARLDIDWRWGPELRKQGTLVSVNPDAHATDEIANTKFGVAMARKALLPSAQVVNSRSADEVARWLKRA